MGSCSDRLSFARLKAKTYVKTNYIALKFPIACAQRVYCECMSDAAT